MQGANTNGQLGDGTTLAKTAGPVLSSATVTYSQVSLGTYAACGVP